MVMASDARGGSSEGNCVLPSAGPRWCKRNDLSIEVFQRDLQSAVVWNAKGGATERRWQMREVG